MGLVEQWEELESGLPADWSDARLRLTVEEAGRLDRAAALLAPLQPSRVAANALALRAAPVGLGPSPETVRRALGRLDAERLHGILTAVSVGTEAARTEQPAAISLAESWDAAVAALPADWSDLLGEIELDSSDYVEPGALHLSPINPRRVGDRTAFRFRSASRYGYGASPGMVRRCLERCDAVGVRGRVHVLRALSDTHTVATQGPVWQIDGEHV